MVNSAYISRYNRRALNAIASDKDTFAPDYTHPESKLNYRSEKWSDLNPDAVKDIVHIENEQIRIDAETHRLLDFEHKIITAINAISSITSSLSNVLENIQMQQGVTNFLSLSTLKSEAKTAIISTTLNCNIRSYDGEYVFSGNAINVKPLQDGLYKGGNSNLTLYLNGQHIGEIAFRCDDVAIVEGLQALKAIEESGNANSTKVRQDLDKSFIRLISIKENLSMFLKQVQNLIENYRNRLTTMKVDHESLASRGITDYYDAVTKQENAYNLMMNIAKKTKTLYNKGGEF